MLAAVPSGTVDATLTGRAATDALRAYVSLGRLDARFDARRVANAVRSAGGRARLLASVAVASLRARVRGASTPRVRVRAHRAGTPRRAQGRSYAAGDPHPASLPAGAVW